MYFGEKEYQKNLEKYKLDLEAHLKKSNDYFGTLPLNEVIKDNNKIIFQGQFDRI